MTRHGIDHRSAPRRVHLPALFLFAFLAPTDAECQTPGGPSSGVKAILRGVRLMNYYPSRNAQTNMWSNWEPAAINTDFRQIAALKANCVRVVLFPRTSGYPI